MLRARPYLQYLRFPQRLRRTGTGALLCALLLFGACSGRAAEPSATALAAFARSAGAVEQCLAAPAPAFPSVQRERLRRGGLQIENRTAPDAVHLSDAILRHWSGATFVPGATAADFEHLMTDFAAYPQVFAGQIVRVAAQPAGPARYQVDMRTRQHYVLTIVLDVAYNFTLERPGDPARSGLVFARSNGIHEIDSPGTPREHPVEPARAHGFLWRLNTYWSYREQDGGLYLQVDTVSLSRAIPPGLAWLVEPFVDRVPRNSLEFTLGSVVAALRHQP